MPVFICKMCGGSLNVQSNSPVVECEYCGTTQTVLSADGEKKAVLYNRASKLLKACEFDKAAGIFESIIADFPDDAKAYWCLVLCRFGIEYVEDPSTGKKIPTCHRSSFDCVFDDKDFEFACEYADDVTRRMYREEAKKFEELRKSIIEVSGREKPYDIFICYKETGINGGRTIDSVIAQDVYDKLTEAGYRVFFSRISLEDKLGREYEPYIFAALNSAKIMLVFGTDYDHFNAVWVKNEWSRFLKLMEKDKEKRLIPCFKDIDAYDMPKEFKNLQAQDMGKIGADQDLIRAIKKLLPIDEPVIEDKDVQEFVQQFQPPAPQPVLTAKEMRKNNPHLIRTIDLVEAYNDKDFFPARQATSYPDRGRFPCLSIQLILYSPIGISGEAQFNIKLFDDNKNQVLDETRKVRCNPDNNKFALMIYLVGLDGSKIKLGRYYIEAWIENSAVFEYTFVIIDSTVRGSGGAPSYEENYMIKYLLEEKQRLEKALSEQRGLFAARKRKEIEAELNRVTYQLNNFTKF